MGSGFASRGRGAGPLLLTALLVGALALAGCSRPPAKNDQFYQQKLTWRSCAGQFQCSKLTVPVNYADPAGPTIQLAVIKAPATDPAHRIGSLITNPGGPGASGVTYLKQAYPTEPDAPSDFGPSLRADYDMVSFDPRGVGHSAPVHCLSAAQLDQFTALNPNPTTPADINATVAADKAFVAACQARSGALLPYLGTLNAARDMDVLRAALGDQKLNYLGFSYGTYLGAIYTELFGDRVGRMVLDGPLPPDLTSEQLDLQQARGFQTELNRFVADCVHQPDCPLGTDPAVAPKMLAAFLTYTGSHPLATGTPRALNGALAQTGLVSAMYDSPTSWPKLRRALSSALAGDGHRLLALADDYNERHHNGHYSNSDEANIAINCVDHPSPVHSTADVLAKLPAYEQASPLIGAGDDWSELPCAFWPAQAQTQPHPVHYAGQPPILVVGNTGDPATPYPGAQDMARQLGSAVLLTYNGDGHTAYGRDITCINNAVDTYLTKGTPPPPHTICPPSPGS